MQRRSGAAGDMDRTRLLELFAGKQPYQIDGTKTKTRLKLVSTDRMPIVRVQLNGGEPANFGVDTGVAEGLLN